MLDSPSPIPRRWSLDLRGGRAKLGWPKGLGARVPGSSSPGAGCEQGTQLHHLCFPGKKIHLARPESRAWLPGHGWLSTKDFLEKVQDFERRDVLPAAAKMSVLLPLRSGSP